MKGLSIARVYFDTETTEPLEVERLLRTMRDDLVALALREGSSVLTAHLQASIARHGEVRLTPVTLQLIEEAAGQWAAAQPAAADLPIARWFRALIAERLAGEGIRTLGELVAFINRRGGSSWWRSVPRIGVGRARVLVAWLRRHATAIGQAVEADVELTDSLAAPATAGTILVKTLPRRPPAIGSRSPGYRPTRRRQRAGCSRSLARA